MPFKQLYLTLKVSQSVCWYVHQEGHNDEELRNVLQVQGGSWWLFSHLRPYVLYIFGNFGQNPVQ